MDSAPFLRFIVAGRLQRNFILPVEGSPALDTPGGGLLYAACGLKLWDSSVGLVSRVGEDYPQEWLDALSQRGFDTRGIRVLPQAVDARFFAAYPDPETAVLTNPVAQFARLDLPFPKPLLGYVEPGNQLDSRYQPTDVTIHAGDFPADYLDATVAHIAPLDFLSHTLLPSTLRQGHVTTISIDPSPGYMTPVYWDDIPSVLRGVNIFHVSEEPMRSLFYGRSSDLWEMAEAIAGYGCEVVVIRRGLRGQLVYDHAHKTRWLVPAYPARVVDPTGAGDAFCGGFLAGYRESYDAVEAALQGSISASLTVEGTGPFYGLDALPSLVRMRQEILRDRVQSA